MVPLVDVGFRSDHGVSSCDHMFAIEEVAILMESWRVFFVAQMQGETRKSPRIN